MVASEPTVRAVYIDQSNRELMAYVNAVDAICKRDLSIAATSKCHANLQFSGTLPLQYWLICPYEAEKQRVSYALARRLNGCLRDSTSSIWRTVKGECGTT